MENPTGSVDESPAHRTVIITPRLSISTDTSSWHCTRLGQPPHSEATSAPVRSARSRFLFCFFYLFVSPPPDQSRWITFSISRALARRQSIRLLTWGGWAAAGAVHQIAQPGESEPSAAQGQEGGGRDRRQSNRWAASVQNNQRWISQANVKRHTDRHKTFNSGIIRFVYSQVNTFQWNISFQSLTFWNEKLLIRLHVCLALLSFNFYYTG